MTARKLPQPRARADMREGYGEEAYNAKLTAPGVAACRDAYRQLGVSSVFLAEVMGVSHGAMYHALSGKTWPHVPGALGWGFGNGRGRKKRGAS